jgi:hypothetical protein
MTHRLANKLPPTLKAASLNTALQRSEFIREGRRDSQCMCIVHHAAFPDKSGPTGLA